MNRKRPFGENAGFVGISLSTIGMFAAVLFVSALSVGLGLALAHRIMGL